MEARDRLIVALDVAPKYLVELVENLSPVVRWFKIGARLIAPGLGVAYTVAIRDVNPSAHIFYDLKLHETPDSTEITIDALAEYGFDFISVIAKAGVEAMRRAVQSAGVSKILAVTTLTSDSGNLAEETRRLALDASQAGVAGLICPPNQVMSLAARSDIPGRIIVVCPGIRPSGSLANNHKQFTTPSDAIRLGADYLVVGRPITAAPDPREAAEKILEEMR